MFRNLSLMGKKKDPNVSIFNAESLEPDFGAAVGLNTNRRANFSRSDSMPVTRKKSQRKIMRDVSPERSNEFEEQHLMSNNNKPTPPPLNNRRASYHVPRQNSMIESRRSSYDGRGRALSRQESSRGLDRGDSFTNRSRRKIDTELSRKSSFRQSNLRLSGEPTTEKLRRGDGPVDLNNTGIGIRRINVEDSLGNLAGRDRRGSDVSYYSRRSDYSMEENSSTMRRRSDISFDLEPTYSRRLSQKRLSENDTGGPVHVSSSANSNSEPPLFERKSNISDQESEESPISVIPMQITIDHSESNYDADSKITEPPFPSTEEQNARMSSHSTSHSDVKSRARCDSIKKDGIKKAGEGKWEECKELLNEALDMQKLLNYPPLEIAHTLHHLGLAYNRQQNYEKALDVLKQAVRVRKKYNGKDLDIAATLHTIGVVKGKSGDVDGARRHLEIAVSMQTLALGKPDEKTVKILKHYQKSQ